MKATATAHPIQGLIKYHGKIDEYWRLPSHNSISVNVASLKTTTTVEFSPDYEEDILIVDGRRVYGGALERAKRVLDLIRREAGISLCAKVCSVNNFPTDVGLGSSSSGFAALAAAAALAAGLDYDLDDEEDLQRLSRIARVGSGSAARSVVGGFSEWVMATSHEASYAYRLAGDEVPLYMVIAVIPSVKDLPTTEAQRETEASPLYWARLAYIPRMLAEMRRAIAERDVDRIGELAETDTLNLHAVTMTGPGRVVLWQPATVAVIREVRRMRAEGIKAYFSIDTGATVYINTHREFVGEVVRRVRKVEGVSRVIVSRVGGPVREERRHLF